MILLNRRRIDALAILSSKLFEEHRAAICTGRGGCLFYISFVD